MEQVIEGCWFRKVTMRSQAVGLRMEVDLLKLVLGSALGCRGSKVVGN